MSTKFEQLLDYIVNEEMEKAQELFHEIVVEKSREIYENLISEEIEEEDVEENAEEEGVEEDMDTDEVEEGMEEEGMEPEMEDAYSLEADDTTGDETDDLGKEVDDDDSFGGDEEMPGEEPSMIAVKDDVAELTQMMNDLAAKLGVETGEPGMDSEMPDMGDDDDMPGDDNMPKETQMGFMEGRRLTREYVENVGDDWHKGSAMKAQGKYVGAGSGDTEGAPQEGKSPIANLKKPSIGDTSPKNLVQGHSEPAPDGTKPHGKAGGFLSAAKEDNAGNGNVPGGKMGVKNLKKVPGGHGAEKRGAGPGPVGSGTGEKAGQTSMGVQSSLLKPLK